MDGRNPAEAVPTAKRGLTRRSFLSAAGIGAVALAAGGLGYRIGSPPSPQERPRLNVVIYLADTLRPDHLGCYGYRLNTAPHIDALAHRAALFERCYSTAPWTKPSVASLFTGVVPRVHQAVATVWSVSHMHETPVQALRESFRTLPELFALHGYHTAIFQTNPHVQKEFGFARRVEKYRFENSQGPSLQMDEVLQHLAAEAREPFFLYVHEIDPHGPYRPEPEDYEQLHEHDEHSAEEMLSEHDRALLASHLTFYERLSQDPDVPAPKLGELSPQGVAYQRSRYDAEIRRVDRQFGRLLDYLQHQGLFSRTIVVVLADHGEAFGEHGAFGHRNSLFDEEIRVPLILSIPGGPMGLRVPHTVSLCDLYPTLARLTGLEPPDYVQGRPLLAPDGQLTVGHDRIVFASLDKDPADPAGWDSAMVQGSIKVLATEGGHRVAAYDTTEDPLEQKDLLQGPQADPDKFRWYVDCMRQRREQHVALAKRFGPAEWFSADQEYREQIGALGYL